jgi:hypothetical protein
MNLTLPFAVEDVQNALDMTAILIILISAVLIYSIIRALRK